MITIDVVKLSGTEKWMAECNLNIDGRVMNQEQYNLFLRTAGYNPTDVVLELIEKINHEGWRLR